MSIEESDIVRMVGIDGLGFDAFVNDKKIRFDFEDAISNAEQARECLVKMSKEAASSVK